MNTTSPVLQDDCQAVATEIVALLDGMFREGAGLHEPLFDGNEWDYVKSCIDTGWVSTAGAFVDRFETSLCELTGARHAVATINGTAALQACLMLAGVRPGDEVIVPGLSFVATANTVAYCGAVPHFADIERASLGLDAPRLDEYLNGIADRRATVTMNRENGRPIRAVICMHTFGHPSDMGALMTVCDAHGLTLIEDAAESLGSTYRGRHTGSIAAMGALSFNGNKIATAGGGGALLTDDPDLAGAAKHLTTTAKVDHPFEFIHDQVGYNFRLPNLNAALGCAQLEALPRSLALKRRLAEHYASIFEGVSGVSLVTEPELAHSNYWLNVLLLDPEFAAARDDILGALNERGIRARAAWRPLNRLPMFAHCPAMPLTVVDDIYTRAIALPSGAALSEEAIDRS